MKSLLATVLLLALLPLSAAASDSSAARVRVYVGLVADEVSSPQAGLLVRAVAPQSPASHAAIQPGDLVLRVGDTPMDSRHRFAEVVKACSPGTLLPVEILRGGKLMVIQVRVQARPAGLVRLRGMAEADGAGRPAHAITISEELRIQIRRIRASILSQLSALPGGMNTGLVTDELQALRDLARDSNAGRAGWMSGRAGAITIRFRDEEGFIVLHGADNLLELVLYDLWGAEQARYPLNSENERRNVPEGLLLRLRQLR